MLLNCLAADKRLHRRLKGSLLSWTSVRETHQMDQTERGGTAILLDRLFSLIHVMPRSL